MQKLLSPDQIEEFYHETFVDDQVRDYLALVKETAGVVVDVGGGCGYFANRLQRLTSQGVRVLDTDEASITACRRKGVDAVIGDALNPAIRGDETVVSFNLILHHLVGPTERTTRDLQSRALAVWRRHVSSVFVNEYIYESYVSGLSGRLIFTITKSRLLSWIGKAVAVVVPALRANTFGVGVRFRSHQEWLELFSGAGFRVERVAVGAQEHIALPRRLLLIKTIRRDSFFLVPV